MLDKATKDLTKADKTMGKLIQLIGPIDITPHSDLFRALVNSIISQLISAKAADTVFARLSAKVNHNIAPEPLLKLTQQEFREAGVGAQKFGYIQGLSQTFKDDPAYLQHLLDQPDAVVIKHLTALSGIEKWTAQMFLIFALDRPDVFAPDDLGLQKAMKMAYPKLKLEKKKDYIAKAEDWSPWRSIASRYLWKSLHVLEGRDGVRW